MLRLPARGNVQDRASKKRGATPPMTKGNMQVRVVALAALVAIVFAILATRLWYLQVLASEDFTKTAQATHTREVKMPAQRGVIYDRDGKVLANNVPGLNVTVIPSKVSRKKVKELVEIMEGDTESVLERYDAALEQDPYGAMLLKENADRDAVTYIAERTSEFPGVAVNDDWIRSYPERELASHVLGYTGAVTSEELKQEYFKDLANDAVVGKSGVELAYEEELSGDPGTKTYNIDAVGRSVAVRRADGTRADGAPEIAPELGRPSSIEDPVAGKSLQLTLDLELQKAAETELDAAMARAQQEGYSGEGGAVVAMDPSNGEILAMASRPTFDPQLFVGGITGAEEAETFEYLNSEYANSPFTNRAIAGAYPGASTFKVFTGLAGFSYGVIDASTTVTDNGGCFEPANTTGSCFLSWRQSYGTGTTHGTQNFAEAVMDSNDKFFYQVADWLWQRTEDEDLLPKFYERFGFGSLTGVDLPGETEGRIPTREWFEWFQKEINGSMDRPWGVADWINLSIGQGDLLVSPIQMAQAYASVENGGTLVTPHVGKAILDESEKVEKQISPEPEKRIEFDSTARNELLQGLRMVTGPDGTAASAFVDSKLSVLGKSGTGERGNKDPVSWFGGWAEDQEKPLVVIVMVEGSGASEVTAAPAVRRILESYYNVDTSPKQQATDSSLVSTYAGTPAQ